MALNPPLLGDRVPMGIVGERFCVQRGTIKGEFDGPDGFKVRGDGVLYLTTVRICFVLDKPTTAVSAIDIPLQGISEEDFCQPIFGANYLKGVVAPVPGRGMPGPTKFRLYFYAGGCQTFLDFFFKIMEKYKVADAAARRAFFESAPAVTRFIHDQQAYVDPSDPTVIYVVQPAAVERGGYLSPTTVPYAPPWASAPPPGAPTAGAYMPAPHAPVAPTTAPGWGMPPAGGSGGAGGMYPPPPASGGGGHGYASTVPGYAVAPSTVSGSSVPVAYVVAPGPGGVPSSTPGTSVGAPGHTIPSAVAVLPFLPRV